MNDLILEESVIFQYGYDLNGLPTDVMQMSPILSFINTLLMKINLKKGLRKTTKNFIHRNRCPRPDSNRAHLKDSSDAFPLKLTRKASVLNKTAI